MESHEMHQSNSPEAQEPNIYEAHATKASSSNPWMISTLVLVGAVIGFGVSQIPYFKGTPAPIIQQQAAAPAQQKQILPPPPTLNADQSAKVADDDPVIGDPNAPITMVEFSDFQCPFCKLFYDNAYAGIKKDYIDTGKVKIVFRDYPLDKHPEATPAALAANCANEQGKFEGMHDAIFVGQDDWSGNTKGYQEIFDGYAKTLGLDMKQFSDCVKTEKYGAEIKKDITDGYDIGVDGTPGFFINGTFISGALSYERVFKPVFEATAEGKKWEIQIDYEKRELYALIK